MVGVARFMIVGMLAATGLAAGTNPESRQPARSGTDFVGPGKNPYARIFRPSPSLKGPVEQNVTTDEMKPRVVCGMVVVPVAPDLDPKFLARSKPSPEPASRHEYKIRKITPQVCTR